MPKYTTFWLELTRTSFYRNLLVKGFYRLTVGEVNFPNSHLYAASLLSDCFHSATVSCVYLDPDKICEPESRKITSNGQILAVRMGIDDRNIMWEAAGHMKIQCLR